MGFGFLQYDQLCPISIESLSGWSAPYLDCIALLEKKSSVCRFKIINDVNRKGFSNRRFHPMIKYVFIEKLIYFP